MRIAICIRGSLRTWEYCKYNVFNIFGRLAREDIFVEWFFDTWDTDVNIKARVDRTGKMTTFNQTRILNDDDLNIIRQDFTSRGITLANLTVHKFDETLSNPASMFKMQYIANMSKRKFELQHNMRFDIVVQCRPDVIFPLNDEQINELVDSIKKCGTSNSLNFHEFKERKTAIDGFLTIPLDILYFAGMEHIPLLQDLLFFGNSAIMDFLSSANIRINDEYEMPKVAHFSHFLHLIRKSVFVNNYSIPWFVVRQISVDNVFNYDDELEKIKETQTYDPMTIVNIGRVSKIWYDSIHAVHNKVVK